MNVSQEVINLVKAQLSALIPTGVITRNDLASVISRLKDNSKESSSIGQEKLLSRSEVADILKISTRTLDRLIRENTINCLKIGKRSVRIPFSEVRQLINNETRN